MTFDDLFALLIVVVFIGLPLLNRLRGGAQPGSPPRAPGRPGAPGTGRPQGRPPAGPTAGGGGSLAGEERREAERDDDPMDELSRRLEEARRRVRDAMGESSGSPEASGPRPLVSTPPASQGRTIGSAGMPSGTVGGSGGPRPTVAGSGGPRPTVATPRAPATPPPEVHKRTGTMARSGRKPGLAKATPALEVDRAPGRGAAGSPQERARRQRARTEAATLVSMDSASIRKGLLWHMILGQPAAFGRGRMRSPRPSR